MGKLTLDFSAIQNTFFETLDYILLETRYIEYNIYHLQRTDRDLIKFMKSFALVHTRLFYQR